MMVVVVVVWRSNRLAQPRAQQRYLRTNRSINSLRENVTPCILRCRYGFMALAMRQQFFIPGFLSMGEKNNIGFGSGLPHMPTKFESMNLDYSYTFAHFPLKLTAHVINRRTINIQHILRTIPSVQTDAFQHIIYA